MLTILNRAMLAFVVLITLAAIAILAGPGLLLLLPPALASDAGTVVVPWGDWVSATLTTLNALPIGQLVAAWIVAVLVKLGVPDQIASVLKTTLSDQVLNKAIPFAMNAVQGAVKGRQVTIPIANEVVATAAKYVIDHGPLWMVNWLGGADGIKSKILARIDLEPGAKIVDHTVTGQPAAAAPAAAGGV